MQRSSPGPGSQADSRSRPRSGRRRPYIAVGRRARHAVSPAAGSTCRRRPRRVDRAVAGRRPKRFRSWPRRPARRPAHRGRRACRRQGRRSAGSSWRARAHARLVELDAIVVARPRAAGRIILARRARRQVGSRRLVGRPRSDRRPRRARSRRRSCRCRHAVVDRRSRRSCRGGRVDSARSCARSSRPGLSPGLVERGELHRAVSPDAAMVRLGARRRPAWRRSAWPPSPARSRACRSCPAQPPGECRRPQQQRRRRDIITFHFDLLHFRRRFTGRRANAPTLAPECSVRARTAQSGFSPHRPLQRSEGAVDPPHIAPLPTARKPAAAEAADRGRIGRADDESSRQRPSAWMRDVEPLHRRLAGERQQQRAFGAADRAGEARAPG